MYSLVWVQGCHLACLTYYLIMYCTIMLIYIIQFTRISYKYKTIFKSQGNYNIIITVNTKQ